MVNINSLYYKVQLKVYPDTDGYLIACHLHENFFLMHINQ